MSARAVLSTTAAGLLVAAGVGGYMLWDQRAQTTQQDDAARAAATAFARAWSARTLDQAPYVGTSPQAAASNFATATRALGSGRIQTAVGEVKRSGTNATAQISVRWTLPGGAVFSWTDPVALTTSSTGSWGVQVQQRSLWHPKLQANDAFTLSTQAGKRGEIRGKGGAGLMTNQTVHDVQLDLGTATIASARAVESITGVSGLVAKKQAGGKGVVPVVTYRDDDYQERKRTLTSLPGVVVADRQQPLAPTRTFGQPFLGQVGAVTAEQLKKDPKLTAGVYVGQGGLQGQYDALMRPTAGVVVSTRAQPSLTLFNSGAKDGSNLATTLDPAVQAAAEAALTKLGTDKVAAIVAIDVPTGNVLAVANGPAYGIERAVTGHYAPGSTLKVVTAYELMKKGLSPSAKVACPQEVTVDGLKIRNFEGETLGDPTFAEDFAHSCNTAFVGAGKNLGNGDLRDAALAFGIGGDWAKQTGVNGAYAGSVPVATSLTDKAASLFGQARTQTSPLALAAMAGTVARGSFVPPAIVTNPAPGGARTPKALDPAVTANLKSMMRLTVTDGTATLLGDTSGGDVYAKTGTAEFNEGGKAGANAWLAGWQGTIAFAVLVADVPAGQGGGTVAAPVARDFLNDLANNP
ncbi:hypothetical protein G9U51_13230 [Calidifontibacter sp. DB0510]|uniref:Penicillin-binding protein n=1 Tax=Metallococcus carri TaxID=1656884 RepID=A0A967B3S8_9MICO|nr:penicillin-binding transpeptidase domain-containing protein [Metallococcus carri]NHN56740.1 hypothetical protein [Metallococcus carri]NOP37883.1 hypothetical protein [Calidifontibacter sp. DB2511S]